MKKKKSLEDDINEFLMFWDEKQMAAFLRDVIPLIELYDVDEESDWVRDEVGDEDLRNVRLIRTVYLLSRFAEFHAGKLAGLKINFKDLYKKMEKQEIVEVVR